MSFENFLTKDQTNDLREKKCVQKPFQCTLIVKDWESTETLFKSGNSYSERYSKIHSKPPNLPIYTKLGQSV